MGNMAVPVVHSTRQKMEMRGVCVRLFRFFVAIRSVCRWRPGSSGALKSVSLWLSGREGLYGSGLDGFECGVGFIHERREIFVCVTFCPQQNNCHLELGDVLLVRDAFVRSHEDLEL